VSAARRVLQRVIALFRSDRAEADLAREIRAHLRLLEDKFVADGLSREEARYAARRAFGGVEQAKEHQRDARTFRWLAGWPMDLKLGARMLIKYPGLTLIGAVAMAFAIATGTATFEFGTQLTRPTLPFQEADRIVEIRLWDTAANRVVDEALHDFTIWREQVRTLTDLGAFRTLERNLIADSGLAEPLVVAEISASALRLPRVSPLLGRLLTEADEQPGAPAVVVIAHRTWQTRLGADPNVVGRRVRLGNVESTVVGVMPEGFGFPLFHRAWIPFRLRAIDFTRGDGPEIHVVGRLGPDVTLDDARTELSTIGRQAAAEYRDTHENLQPQVSQYARWTSGLSTEESRAVLSVNVFMVALLILICSNVALLMFARAVTREDEIAVRSALGATRGRIIAQLFAEALVLAAVAVIAGIAAARFVLQGWLRVVDAESGGRTPFWLHDTLTPATILYAGVLAVIGAACAGMLPALKVTGRGLETRLRRTSAGSGRLGFGGVWTAVIVAQVAMTVAFPATTFFVKRNVDLIQSLDAGFPSREYLSVRLEMDGEGSSDVAARFRAAVLELDRRLAAEPAVRGVTFTSILPRTHHPQRWVEVEGEAAAPGSAARHRVGSASITLDYFDVLGAGTISGRTFNSGDLTSGHRVVIANRSFVQRIFEGRNPVGRRVRYVPPDVEPGPWYEIVGTVKDLGMVADPSERAGLYHPMARGDQSPVNMAIHLQGNVEAFAPRLYALAAAVDPTLRLHDLLPLDKVGASLWLEFGYLYRVLIAVSAIALLLSLAGIYSIMSFTVSRRTREIGIRVALGSDRRRVVGAIFRRPLTQMIVGIACGGLLVFTMTDLITGLSAREAAIAAAYLVLMTAVCMLACIVPTRRALRIEPSEALRTE
jgi:predicted permease